MDKEEALQKATFMLKKILYSIEKMNIDESKYLLSDNLYNKLNDYINKEKEHQENEHYDNVKVIPSLNREFEDEENNYLEIIFNCNCFKYTTSLVSNNILYGDNSKKIDIIIKGIVKKLKNVETQPSYSCKNCGTSYDVIENSICPNCGSIYDLKKYDYIMDDLNI